MSETVTLALSEVRSLITKAARGAGLSWGQAEEAGWAAEWLARRGFPAGDWATVWLAARLKGVVSPVELGAAWADACANTAGISDRAVPDGVVAPGYLLPFLHRIAQAGSAVTIMAARGQVARISARSGVVFGPCWQSVADGWRVSMETEGPVDDGANDRVRRPVMSVSVLDCLEGLALGTTVPRSDTSRQDAGSLGGDND